MKHLSISQAYLLCAVNDKGTISDFSTEKLVGFVAAGLLDLRLAGCVSLEEKRVSTSGPLPASRSYLEPLYDFIAQKEPVKLSKVAESYTFSFTNKQLDALFDAVGASLEAPGMLQAAKKGLLGGRRHYVPTRQAVSAVVDMLRAELLEEGPISDEGAALATLLDQAKCLKRYFSDFERKEIRRRLQELARTPEGQAVRQMVEYIQLLIVAISAGCGGAGGAG